MLEDAEQENSNVVTWLPHGKAFKVSNKNAFVASVLPRYFKAKKFTYFSDILRIWGFVRLKKQDRGAYFHRLFAKGKPELSRNLSRKQMKESMSGWPLPGGEPNLYADGAENLIAEGFSTSPSDGIDTTAALPIVIVPIDALRPVVQSMPEEKDEDVVEGDKQELSEMEQVEV